MNKKRFLKILILFILLIICVILILASGYKIISWLKDNNRNKEIIDTIHEKAVVLDKNNKYNVDLQELRRINSETVGWIKLENTNIEYPIVQTTDNSFYLNHSFDKSYNEAGWIFADYRNNLDGTDKNIVIYGHNRRDGSMFDSLKKVLTDEWYNNEENMKVHVIIGDEEQEYIIFSAYKIKKEDYYLTTHFNNDNEYQAYINRAKEKSIKNFNIDVGIDDKLITLSTCANDNNYRVVLHAKKMDFDF